jgi:hypothetical protein
MILRSILMLMGMIMAVAAYGSAQAPASAGTTLEQALIANSKAVREAQVKKDTGFLKSTLTDDFVEVRSEGNVYERKDFIDDAADGNVTEFYLYKPRMLMVDENAAIVTYDCILKMTEGDAPNMAPRYQHVSDLWVKQNGQWRLKFQQATASRPVD